MQAVKEQSIHAKTYPARSETGSIIITFDVVLSRGSVKNAGMEMAQMFPV